MDVERFQRTKFTDRKHNPFTEPDFRWRRCQYLLQRGRRPIRDLDVAIVGEAWRFCRARSRCRTGKDLKRLVRRFYGVADSYYFHMDADPLRRAEVKARLLADDSDEVIAAKCGVISPPGVRAYHDLFFCVRPYLTSQGYIMSQVLRCPPDVILAVDDQEVWMRLFGYYHGSEAVDQVIEYFRDPPVMPASLSSLDMGSLEALREKLRLQEILANRVMQNDVDRGKLAELRGWHTRVGGLGGHSSAEFVSCPLLPPAALPDCSLAPAVVTAVQEPVDPRNAMSKSEAGDRNSPPDPVKVGPALGQDMPRIVAEPGA